MQVLNLTSYFDIKCLDRRGPYPVGQIDFMSKTSMNGDIEIMYQKNHASKTVLEKGSRRKTLTFDFSLIVKKVRRNY